MKAIRILIKGNKKPRVFIEHLKSYKNSRYGRSDWIRTSGHLNPIQVLYQTEPHPVKQQNLLYYILKKKASLFCKKFQKYLIYIEIIISNRIFMYKSSVLFSITC